MLGLFAGVLISVWLVIRHLRQPTYASDYILFVILSAGFAAAMAVGMSSPYVASRRPRVSRSLRWASTAVAVIGLLSLSVIIVLTAVAQSEWMGDELSQELSWPRWDGGIPLSPIGLRLLVAPIEGIAVVDGHAECVLRVRGNVLMGTKAVTVVHGLDTFTAKSCEVVDEPFAATTTTVASASP